MSKFKTGDFIVHKNLSVKEGFLILSEFGLEYKVYHTQGSFIFYFNKKVVERKYKLI